ncbi:MAG: hypothetical protein LC792_11735, partial [Actinobacteria bacterium]|nr:hypothetical protein [Actinomycetota bacterium]
MGTAARDLGRAIEGKGGPSERAPVGGGHYYHRGARVTEGFKASPLRTSNVDEAAKALAEGRYVELDQPRQVSTLVDKLAAMVEEAKRAGTKPVTYDLCKVSVKGTNLFCAESKGIPRIKMPQLQGVPLPGSKADKLGPSRLDPKRGEVNLYPEFLSMLKARGVKTTNATERVDYLKASQNELDGAKVAGIAKYLAGGGKIEGHPLFTSRDNYIVDGHHRWAAQVANDLADGKSGDEHMAITRVDMGIIDLLAESNAFAKEWGIPPASVSAPIPTAKRPKVTKVKGEQGAHTPLSGKGTPAGKLRARHLIKWFVEGAGGKIAWGTPGDWRACVDIASRHMLPAQAAGFCSNRHVDATGGRPGHAPAELALAAGKKGAKDAARAAKAIDAGRDLMGVTLTIGDGPHLDVASAGATFRIDTEVIKALVSYGARASGGRVEVAPTITSDGEPAAVVSIDGSRRVLWSPTASQFGPEAADAEVIFTDASDPQLPPGWSGTVWPATDPGTVLAPERGVTK